MNIDKLLSNVWNSEKLLTIDDIKKLCKKVEEILSKESTVINVSSPVIVCGDIHGQFKDMKELFNKGGRIKNINYLFMGDYVDRGPNSVDTIVYLLLLKVKFPDKITLLRGNHESVISFRYGFYNECFHKYNDVSVWKLFIQLFELLPLAAVIDDKIFCVHGGLSSQMKSIDDIRILNKPTNYEDSKHLICDLLWSDPMDKNGYDESPRGKGITNFGPDVTNEFLYNNDLKFVSRGHRFIQRGYQWTHNGKIVTIFSAPNYERTNNLAAIMEIRNNRYNIKTFGKPSWYR